MPDELAKIVAEFKGEKGALIPILQKVQEKFGYLPKEAISEIAKSCGMSESEVFGVASFYAQFYFTPRGKHTVKVCLGTACHVRGAAQIVQVVEDHLGIQAGETTEDYRYTYEVVYCLGSCGLAPVAMVDDHVVGHLVPENMIQILEDLD